MERVSTRLKSLRQRIAETRENGDVVQTVIIIGIFIVMVFTIGNVLFRAISASNSAQPSASVSPTPTSVPTQAAAPAAAPSASAPVDIPVGPILLVAAIFIAVVAVIMLSVWFFRKVAIANSNTTVNMDAWKTLFAKHHELRAAWASYELDAVKLLDFPLMTDMREPTTIAMHKALKHAQSLEPKDVQAVRFIDAATSPFAAAVNELDVAFHAAESEAQRVAWSKFSPEERKRLTTAKNLLHIAMDSAASASERQMAYKRVFKELEGLINIPATTRLELESRHQLSLAA